VATSKKAVRELKNKATSLVRAAERGERYVITRRGRAVAMLGPLDRDLMVRDSSRPRFNAWERERAAFQRLEPKLQRLRGRFVAVKAAKVVDSDDDAQRLIERVARSVAAEPFFVGRVGEASPVVDMPGFALE
jgi:prevent-host-death family protein